MNQWNAKLVITLNVVPVDIRAQFVKLRKKRGLLGAKEIRISPENGANMSIFPHTCECYICHREMDDMLRTAQTVPSPPAPAKDGISESCPVCGGNDKDVPCAYPSEEKLGCFRDSRLNLISERERNLIAAGWNYLSNHSPENGRKLEEALAAYERKEE